MQPVQRWIRRRQRFTRLLMALTLLLGVSTAFVAAVAPAAAASTCGSTLVPAANWLWGYGVSIYSNAQGGQSWGYNNCGGTDDYINGVDAGGEWQCVELVNRLYLTRGWTTAHWFGNGDTLVNHLPSGLAAQNNGSITTIVPGDVVTYNGNGSNPAGHAGVVYSASGTSVTIYN